MFVLILDLVEDFHTVEERRLHRIFCGLKGYEHWAKINNLKEAAKTLNYLTENNLLQYADLEKKVEDIHSS